MTDLEPARPLDTRPPRPGLDGRRAGTLASRVTGLVRVIFTAAALGDELAADSFFLANIAPNIVYELLIGGVLSATLVPLFVEARPAQQPTTRPSALFSVGFGGDRRA